VGNGILYGFFFTTQGDNLVQEMNLVMDTLLFLGELSFSLTYQIDLCTAPNIYWLRANNFAQRMTFACDAKSFAQPSPHFDTTSRIFFHEMNFHP